MRKKFENGSKFINKKKKKIDIGKIAADAMKKGSTSKFITRKKKKFDLADLPSLQKKKNKKINLDTIVSRALEGVKTRQGEAQRKGKLSKFITKKSPEEIRDREKMRRASKMGGGMMMGRRFGMKKGSFPDLNKDGKITKADILIGRGVIKKKKK